LSDHNGHNETDDRSGEVRTKILDAINALIASGGIEAATTRAIAAAAGVQAPTIYRLFGDKRGLLDAAAEHGLAAFVASKAIRVPHGDPVQDLRDGWYMHIEFGEANPGLFSIMSSDPHLREQSPAHAAGTQMLRQAIKRIALVGRLRISQERAVALMQSVSVGTVLTLLAQPEQTRDPGLATAAFDAVIAAITGEILEPEHPTARQAAATLRASLDSISTLTKGETHLLTELLDRISNAE
jgi:AcrR family transcriptional regulator